MATDVEVGLGSTFKLADGAGLLTLLGEITEMPIPTGTADLIDASHYGTVGFRDYIQSPLRDGEEADFVLNWIPNSATDILAVAARGNTRAFEIRVFQDTGVYIFTGSVLVRDYIRTNPLDDKRTGTLRVKWVSAITEVWDATP
jgi:hypothetical protein